MKKIPILIFSLFITSHTIFGQVKNLGLGFGGSLMEFHIDENNTTWVGVDVSGLFKSNDKGKTWIHMNNQVVNDHVNAILVHPDDSNLIILGTYAGIQRSTDRGNSWVDIRDGLPPHTTKGNDNFSAPITSLAIDSNNRNIIYAGGGSRRSASKYDYINLGETLFGKGMVYKSYDKGKTWIDLRTFSKDIPSTANILDICISNQVNETVFIGTSRGIYKSEDGGKHWKLKGNGLPHNQVIALTMSAKNNKVLYCALKTMKEGYGVYKSIDMGENWKAINNGIPDRYANGDLMPFHLLVDWKDDNIVYLATTEQGSVWKTYNAGDSWENAYAGRVKSHGWGSYGNEYTKVYGFAQSPVDNLFLMTGEHWAHKTEDGGKSWYQVYSNNESPFKNTGADFTVADYVKVSPTNPNLVFMCEYDQGLYRSTDGGETWENKNKEMTKDGISDYLVAVSDLAFSADGKDIYCTIDMSYYKVGYGWYIKKSSDGGETWSIFLKGIAGTRFHTWGMYQGLETDPTNNDIIYIAPFDAKGYTIIKTEDKGKTWEKLGEGLEEINNSFRHLIIDKSKPKTLYITASMHNGKAGRIYKSSDGGKKWKQVNETQMENPWDLAVHPTDSKILYGTMLSPEGGVYKSIDGGIHWTPSLTKSTGMDVVLKEKLKANNNSFGAIGIAIDPKNPETIYATLGAPSGHWEGDYTPAYGLARSKDGGKNWSLIGQKFIKYGRMTHIDIDPNHPNLLYIGTSGNGGFKVDVSLLNE